MTPPFPLQFYQLLNSEFSGEPCNNSGSYLLLFTSQRSETSTHNHIVLGSKRQLTIMSGFRSSKQLISIGLTPNTMSFSSTGRHSSSVFRHLHRLAPRTPHTNTIDRHRRASALSHPAKMAVGLLHPQTRQPVDTKRAQYSQNQFDDLVQTLKDALGPSSGLDSSDVNLEALKAAMRKYKTEQGGWERYDFPDSDCAYTRNLVDEGNGKSNLVSPTPSSSTKL